MSSAFLLPVMVDPRTGLPFLLLSQNKLSFGWPAGSCRLSFFGGKRRLGESPEQAAGREAIEESVGAVAFRREDTTREKHWKRCELLTESLLSGEYVGKYDFGSRVVFVVNVPWDPGCVRRFRNNHSLLTAVSKCCRQQGQRRDTMRDNDFRLSRGERMGLFPTSRENRSARHRWLVSSSALSFRRDKHGNPVIRGVRPQYLEKQRLVLLSVAQIQEACDSGDRHVTADGDLYHLLDECSRELRFILGDLHYRFPSRVSAN